MSGWTGGRPAKRGGISIIAFWIRTATGFRSPDSASKPEALGLERDRTAAAEGVEDRWWPVGEAAVDLGLGLGQNGGDCSSSPT